MMLFVLCILFGAMDSLEAWDLEMELLGLVGTGSASIAKMASLSRRISTACSNVPVHVQEIAMLPNNEHRERALHRWCNKQVWRKVLPDVYDFDIPLTRDGIHEDMGQHSVLCPHDVFATLHTVPELFQELMTGPPGNLTEFWNGCAHTPWAQRHPVPQVQEDPEHAVPIGIYGDDHGLFRTEKVLCLFWGSVALHGLLSLDSRIVFCAIQCKTLVEGTLRVIYAVWQWSLTWLALGVHPDVDHTGRPFSLTFHPLRFLRKGARLAGDYVGAFSELRGDWKWQYEALSLEQYYGASFCCHLCRAHYTIARLLFTLFARDSHLRRTLVTWPQFREWYKDKSPLFRIPGFSIWRAWADAMHCLDLGVYQTIIPSCLVELVAERVFPGATFDERFLNAHAEYSDWCRGNGLQPCPRFNKIAIWTDADYPSWNMHQAKGAQNKYVVQWLRTVMLRPGVTAPGHGATRLVCFQCWVTFETICARNGRYLTPPDLRAAVDAVEGALLAQNALASDAIAQAHLRWHLIPKHHMTTHMAYDFCQQANPRHVHAYPDEDLIGKMKRLMSLCHGATAGRMGLMRYIILVGVRWWNRLLELRGLR